MKDKVIWITGASSGIGEALAYTLAEQETQLILSSRREPELVRVQRACKNPDRVFVLPLDLENQNSFTNKVEEAIGAFGHIDILVNNGGISQRSLAKDTSLEVDRRIMDINYFGTIGLSKALLPHFLKRKQGRFVVVSSLVGKFGTPYRSGYAASKHALHGFFDALRAELWENGVQVTMICPGFIRTNVSINALTAGGDRLGEMDDAQENGMSPEKCARKITNAIRKEKREVYIGGKEVFGVYMKRFFPGLLARILRKANVR